MVRTLLRLAGPGTLGLMLTSAVVCAPVGSAQPDNPVPGPQPADNAPPAAALPATGPGGDPVVDACTSFEAALNVAAANYGEFAYATAGTGNYVNYQDPNVAYTNVVGRTALRQSAAAALSAARTVGIPAEVSDPMQSWSLHATKLLMVMGLRGGGDRLNESAAELNSIADQALNACSLYSSGGRPQAGSQAG